MIEPGALHGIRGLRVLMTTDAVGGVFTYALTLAGQLARHGAEVHLATMGPLMLEAQRRSSALVERVVVRESTFALEWMSDPWEDVERAGEWLLSLERRLRPDLIHLNGYCHGASGFAAPVVIVGHSCVLSWWEAVNGEAAPAELSRYRSEVQRGLGGARAVMTPTLAMMRALTRHYGPVANPVVVPNGVEPPRPGRIANARKDLSVLAAGRLWDRAKNIEALARIAPRLPWPVRVAGADVMPDGERRALPHVEAMGWLDAAALGRAMEAAAIFAHPARYEPFGLCPLEAALRGCALVLGDIESLREVWTDAALFVEPDDDDALTEAIDSLARDGDRRRELALRGTQRAAAFSARRMAEETAAVYLRILCSGEPSREAPLRARSGGPCA